MPGADGLLTARLGHMDFGRERLSWVECSGFCLNVEPRPAAGSARPVNQDNTAERPVIIFLSAAADPTLIPAASAAARMLWHSAGAARAASSFFRLSAGRPIALSDFVPFALARAMPGSPRCPDIQLP